MVVNRKVVNGIVVYLVVFAHVQVYKMRRA